MKISTTQILVRIVISVLIGGAIGYERESNNMPAGFRTHILVCIGSAVISMLQLEMVNDVVAMTISNSNLANSLKVDIGRVIAQVVSGVGFLGAGTIIHDKGSVKGLTTAASIWVVACIGLAIGMGYYSLSLISGIGVIIVLVILKKLEKRIFK